MRNRLVFNHRHITDKNIYINHSKNFIILNASRYIKANIINTKTASSLSRRQLLILLMISSFAFLIQSLITPAFPDITQFHQTSVGIIQANVPFFFLGFTLSGLFFGVFIEQFNEKNSLVMGILLILCGSGLCLIEHHPYWFLAGRTLQGIGSATFSVIPKAILRRHYDHLAFTRIIALVIAAYGLGLLVAPPLGGIITHYLDWQMNFYLIIILMLLLLPLTVILLNNDKTAKTKIKSFDLAVTAGQFISILKTGEFSLFLIVDALMITIVGILIVMIAFIGQKEFHLNALMIAVLYTMTTAGYFLAGALSKGLTSHLNHKQFIILGAILYLLMAGTVMANELINFFPLWVFMVALFGIGMANGLIDVACQAGAMNLIDKHIGISSALMSVGPWVISVIFTFVLSFFELTTSFWLALLTFCIGLLIVIIGMTIKNKPV